MGGGRAARSGRRPRPGEPLGPAHLDPPVLAPLAVSHITVADLKEVLTKGFDDFMAYRTDIIFLIAVYPIISVLVIAASFRYELLPLVFPLVSGSAILGPFVGVFLYEMSRRRELNLQRHHADNHSWANALSVVRSRNFGKIMMAGMLLVAMYVLWLVCAWGVYQATQGPTTAETAGRFVHDLFLTQAGWWLIVAGGLILGAIPLAIGLVIVMPVLCHATWHLYRKLVPRHHA